MISYMNAHVLPYVYCNRGYTNHCDPETDSDGDGGAQPKLRGIGPIEFSPKGIPHGVVHFPEMVKWAGHMFLFDTCAPEAAHKGNIKEPMDRVRKLEERKTASSMMEWTLRQRTWASIIRLVRREFFPPKEKRKYHIPARLEVVVPKVAARMHRPTAKVRSLLRPNSFSPLASGTHTLLSPAVRVSYDELGSLIIQHTSWPRLHVMNLLRVQLFCSAMIRHPSGDVRTYWSTDTQYPYLGGHRRDMVQISLPGGTHMNPYSDTHMNPYSDTHMNPYRIVHMNSLTNTHVQAGSLLPRWWPSFEWKTYQELNATEQQMPYLFVGWGRRACSRIILSVTHRIDLFVSTRCPPTIVCTNGRI